MPKTRNIGHTASGQSFHFCCTAFVIGLRSRTFVRVSSIDAVKEENKALVRRHERPYITVTLSHGALRPKPRHGVSVISELFEDFFSVGAEQRGGETRLWVTAGEAESRAHYGNLAISSRRGLEVLDKTSLGDLWMFQDFRDRQNLAGGNTVLVEQVRPLLYWFSFERRFKISLQLVAAFLPVFAVNIPWIGGQLSASNQFAEFLELLLLIVSFSGPSLLKPEIAQ